MEKLKSLIDTAHQLRAPGGCPWDAEQDHRSLVQYLLEETHELIDALERGNRDEVLEELGDVLYQVIFHAQHGFFRPSQRPGPRPDKEIPGHAVVIGGA